MRSFVIYYTVKAVWRSSCRYYNNINGKKYTDVKASALHLTLKCISFFVKIPYKGIIKYSRPPTTRKLFIRTPSYPERLGPLAKFVEISTQLTCLETTGYRIKYRTVFMASRTSNQECSKGLDAGKR